MPHIRIPRSWEIPEREATAESVYYNRRTFLRNMGLASIGALALAGGACRTTGDEGADAGTGNGAPIYEPDAEAVRAGRVEWSDGYTDVPSIVAPHLGQVARDSNSEKAITSPSAHRCSVLSRNLSGSLGLPTGVARVSLR